jgi:hypothetical protein
MRHQRQKPASFRHFIFYFLSFLFNVSSMQFIYLFTYSSKTWQLSYVLKSEKKISARSEIAQFWEIFLPNIFGLETLDLRILVF